MKVLLRTLLTLLTGYSGLMLGMALGPRLALWMGGGGLDAVSGLESGATRAAQPDWGGGRLSLSDRAAAGIIDSVRAASEGGSARTQACLSPAGGVVLRQKSGDDYALTMAVPSPGKPGRTAVFELPSAGRFRKQLLPGNGDAEAPAADVPLYPQAVCRTQVGRGTSCFVGFYLTSDSIEAVRAFYVRALGRFGWHRIPVGRPGSLETFTHREEDRTVVLQLRRQDRTTTRIGLVATTSGGPDRSERK